jgi:5-formyltetrahydrofolate cyclo-ligase
MTLKCVKNKYRQSVLQQRKSLSGEDHSALSGQIQEHFLRSFPLHDLGNIALYMPSNKEVGLELLLKEATRLKTITLPVVKPNKQLQFIKPNDECKYSNNKYNILEPVEGAEVKAHEHDLIIVPSIGVDKNGCRLGYGGGYYDRFFAHQIKDVKRPLIIGLLFHFQKIDNVFGEKHDMKFDYIFTELGKEKF